MTRVSLVVSSSFICFSSRCCCANSYYACSFCSPQEGRSLNGDVVDTAPNSCHQQLPEMDEEEQPPAVPAARAVVLSVDPQPVMTMAASTCTSNSVPVRHEDIFDEQVKKQRRDSQRRDSQKRPGQEMAMRDYSAAPIATDQVFVADKTPLAAAPPQPPPQQPPPRQRQGPQRIVINLDDKNRFTDEVTV